MAFKTKYSVTIDIDTAALRGYDDAHLAVAWHAAQANPAEGFDHKGPGELVELVGREIIRRWLGKVDPELWHHQGRHYYWKQLTELGRWEDGTFVPETSPTCDHAAQSEDDADTNTTTTGAASAAGGAL